ncbi:hypothetical protein EON79_04415 [bacterium]|nr:MAG: hypothetical protein EON79_04415 [bacterium]
MAAEERQEARRQNWTVTYYDSFEAMDEDRLALLRAITGIERIAMVTQISNPNHVSSRTQP